MKIKPGIYNGDLWYLRLRSHGASGSQMDLEVLERPGELLSFKVELKN